MSDQPQPREVWGDPNNPATWIRVVYRGSKHIKPIGEKFGEIVPHHVPDDAVKIVVVGPASVDPDKLRVPQDSTNGVNAIIGKWPGDESDTEIAAMLDKRMKAVELADEAMRLYENSPPHVKPRRQCQLLKLLAEQVRQLME